MQIVLRDDIEKIASRTAFSYREVYALSMFEKSDCIEAILQMIAVSGMGVGMYLLQKGIPQETVYRLLHEEAQYVRGRMMPMGTVDNEEKKKFLRGYRDSVRRIRRIGAEIDELRTMRMGTSAGSGGGRCKGRKCDLSGYAASLDRLERDLEEERKGRVRLYERITEAINGLEDTKEQDVLFYRYIKGMTWWEIAEKTLYSERQVHRLHGKALAHLDIPKDVIECQS